MAAEWIKKNYKFNPPLKVKTNHHLKDFAYAANPQALANFFNHSQKCYACAAEE